MNEEMNGFMLCLLSDVISLLVAGKLERTKYQLVCARACNLTQQ